MNRTLPARSIVAVAIAAMALAACTSTPSARDVVQDMIESVDGPTDEQRSCMLDKLDGYSSDEIQALGDANVAVNFDSPDPVANATPEFQDFVDELRSCL